MARGWRRSGPSTSAIRLTAPGPSSCVMRRFRDPEDLLTVCRSLWAVDLGSEELAAVELPLETVTGETDSYAPCREEARRLRAAGVSGLRTRAAALLPGTAGGWRVDTGLQPGAESDGGTIVLFGRRPQVTGWRAVFEGRPGRPCWLRCATSRAASRPPPRPPRPRPGRCGSPAGGRSAARRRRRSARAHGRRRLHW